MTVLHKNSISNHPIKWLLLLLLFNLASALEVQYMRFGVEMSSINISTVRAIDLDSNGELWLGMSNQGVFRFSSGSWHHFDTNNSNLPSNFVTGVANDNLGNTWVATSSSVLIFNETESVLYDSLYNVTGFMAGDEGEIWAGGHYRESVRLEQENWVSYPWRAEDSIVLAGYGYSNFEFTRDKNGGLWALCEENWMGGRAPEVGICRFLDNEWDFFAMLPYRNWSGRYLGGRNIVVHDSNNIFVTGRNSSMLRLKDGVFDTLRYIDSDFQHALASDLTRDRRGNIWGLTEGGLAKFSPNGWERIEADFVLNPTLDFKDVYQNGFILTDSMGITLYHLGNVVSSKIQQNATNPETIIIKKMKSRVEIQRTGPEPAILKIYDIHGKRHGKYHFTSKLLLNKADFTNGIYLLEIGRSRRLLYL